MEEDLTSKTIGYVVPPYVQPPPPPPPPLPPLPPPPPPAFVQGWITYINSYMDIRLKQMYDKIARGYFIIDEASFDQMRVNDIILGGKSLRAIIQKLLGMQPLPPPPVPPPAPLPPPPPVPVPAPVPYLPIAPVPPPPYAAYPYAPPPGMDIDGLIAYFNQYVQDVGKKIYEKLKSYEKTPHTHIWLKDRSTAHIHELIVENGVIKTNDLGEINCDDDCTCTDCDCSCRHKERDDVAFNRLLMTDRLTKNVYEIFVDNGVLMTNLFKGDQEDSSGSGLIDSTDGNIIDSIDDQQPCPHRPHPPPYPPFPPPPPPPPHHHYKQ